MIAIRAIVSLSVLLSALAAGACVPNNRALSLSDTVTPVASAPPLPDERVVPAPPFPEKTENLWRQAFIDPGESGPRVLELQQALAAARFYRGAMDGRYGLRTEAAVIAFHKAHGMPPTDYWWNGNWKKLRDYGGPDLPRRAHQPKRVEIDLGRQLLYLLERNRVEAIIPVSSGNGERYQNKQGEWVRAVTPEGSFVIHRRYDGWRKSYLGELYRPWYFQGGYAVHGSHHVPPRPASHGCVRVPMWEADYLAEKLSLGMPLHVWGSSSS